MLRAQGRQGFGQPALVGVAEHDPGALLKTAARRGEEWSRREAVPSMLTSILALGDRSSERANYQTIQAFRETLESWKKSESSARKAAGASPDYYFIEVGFDAIANASERSFFLNLMTTFSLPDATVDRLTAAGGRILRESPEFKRLLEDLQTP